MEGLMPSPRPKVTKKSDVPKGEQPKENAKTVKLLLVPTNEIEGGEDIPVGFQINAATIEALGAKSSDLKTFKIDLSWKDSLICTIALTEPVLDLSKNRPRGSRFDAYQDCRQAWRDNQGDAERNDDAERRHRTY
jgi:hypothetical protein